MLSGIFKRVTDLGTLQREMSTDVQYIKAVVQILSERIANCPEVDLQAIDDIAVKLPAETPEELEDLNVYLGSVRSKAMMVSDH
jgi:hypothetical protein